MLRNVLASLVVLVVIAGTGLAADGKKGQSVTGTLKKVDASAGTLTIAVKNKKKTADKDFTVPNEAKVVVLQGKEKKESTGKAGLKDEQVKEGVVVTVVSDADGKVVEVRFGQPAKGGKTAAGVSGVVKKVDTSTGTLTLTVKAKKATADKDFTISETTKFILFQGKEKKELAGKEGLKSELLKEGAKATVTSDMEGKVALVQIGGPPKAQEQVVVGTLKKVDAATATVTMAVKAKKKMFVDKDFTIPEGAKVVLFDGAAKKQLSAREALKNELVKEGVRVAVVRDPAGKVVAVRIGTPPKKPKK